MKDLVRTERLVKILQHIDNSNVGVKDLSNKLDVTERQIYRDIQTLRYILHFPIKTDRKRGIYCFDEGYSLKKLSLNRDEIMSVLIAKEVMSKTGSPHSKNFDKVLSNTLSSSDSGQKPPFSIILDSAVPTETIEKQYKELSEAIEECNKVTIKHLGQNNKYSKRDIDPYRLFYSSGFWYVLAYCHKRKDIRTFALDKIDSITIHDKYFFVLKDFDVDKYLSKSWKSYSLGEPEEVVIKFSPSAAQQIKRKQWHPLQKLKNLKEGSLEFSVTVSGHDEIMRWVLTWGAEAEVLKPKKLRKKIALELERTCRLYAGTRT